MTRDDCFRLADGYLVWGDLDKSFHRPECECDRCEAWRRRQGRATRAEVRSYVAKGTGGVDPLEGV